MIYRQRRSKFNVKVAPEISLTPLIDTALVLLVIFMVTTPFMHHGLNIDLPKSQTNEATAEANKNTLYIDRNNNIFFNDMPIKFSDIKVTINQAIGSQKHQRIYIDGDGDISYKTLVKVVDEVKTIPGVEHVILSTEKASER